MNKEDKELLLKYLCMALPYGVMCFASDYEYGDIGKLWCVEPFEDLDPPITIQYPKGNTITKFCSEIKPYLRPMLSMTEEEKEEMHNLLSPEGTAIYENNGIALPINHYGEYVAYEFMNRIIQYLLKNHFDFMGLIPNGIAIEVTENNNPYK